MYKMLVLDLDGTLLNEEQKISDDNVIAIKSAFEMGIHVVLASGRHYKGIVPFLKELNLYKCGCYTISCSGAMVMENQVNRVLYEEPIDRDDLIRIHKTCETMDIDMCGYGKEGFLVHHDSLFGKYDSIANHTTVKKVDFNNLDKELLVYKLNIINESPETAYEIIDYFPAISVDDYTVRDKPNFNAGLFDEMGNFPKFMTENYTITRPLPFFIELFDKDCNKAVGVEFVAKILGVKMSEVIAMGDSGNDLHMIEEVGLGVAMGNASDEVKSIADIITLSNEENGVAKIINDYLLN